MKNEPLLPTTETGEPGHNGHHGSEEETQEELQVIQKNLSSLTRPDGSLVSLTKEQLSLLQMMLRTNSETYKEEAMWRMLAFEDTDEARDHVAAYYEARDLGMDTNPNVALMFALCSVGKEKGLSLMAMLTDTLQHGKWAGAQKKQGGGFGPFKSKSPLS